MALSPPKAASAIYLALQDVSGLDADGNPDPKPATKDFPAGFAEGYDAYAKDGLVLGAENEGGEKIILEDFLRSGFPNSPATTLLFATAFAEYWDTVAVSPGTPSHGGIATVSVTNDALDYIALFEAAILASLSSIKSTPFFLNLITNIEEIAVSAITWTVTETVLTPAPKPIPFPEKIG